MFEIRPTNGVSYEVDYTITAADDTAGSIVFMLPKDNTYYTAVFQILDNTGVVQAIDVVVDDTVAGQITISDGLVYALTADHVIKGIINAKKIYPA